MKVFAIVLLAASATHSYPAGDPFTIAQIMAGLPQAIARASGNPLNPGVITGVDYGSGLVPGSIMTVPKTTYTMPMPTTTVMKEMPATTVMAKSMPMPKTYTMPMPTEVKTPDLTKTMPMPKTYTMPMPATMEKKEMPAVTEMKTPVMTKAMPDAMPMPKTYTMPATFTKPNTFPYPTYTNPSVTTYGNPTIPYKYPTMTYGANMMPRLKCIGTTCFY